MIKHKIATEVGRTKDDQGMGTTKHNFSTKVSPTSFINNFLRNLMIAHTFLRVSVHMSLPMVFPKLPRQSYLSLHATTLS